MSGRTGGIEPDARHARGWEAEPREEQVIHTNHAHPSKTAPVAVLALLFCFAALGLALRDTGSVPVPWSSATPASTGKQDVPRLVFVPNRGQAPNAARYYAQGPGYAFAFSLQKATFAFEKRERGHVLGLRFVGANPRPAIEARRRAPGTVSYFGGSDRSADARSLPTYRDVVYRELWPGIDMVFTGAAGRLEYSFVVHPGAHVADIRLAYEGAERVSLTRVGDLVLRTPLGSLRDPHPRSHQGTGGRRAPIRSAFSVSGARYGIEVGRYDHQRPLVIDPGLAYGTFLGGSGNDGVSDIAVDESGNAYLTGGTYNGAFPTTPGSYKVADESHTAVFVTKLNRLGSDLVYSALVGGTTAFAAGGSGIAVDAVGNAYVTGSTSQSDFPTTRGAYDTTFNGGPFNAEFDGFVFKLGAEGSVLRYSTFLGSSGYEKATDVSVDPHGRAFVTGETLASSFPTTPGALDPTFNGFSDAFVTKLNADGSELVYSTFLGGSSGENHEGVVGNVVVDDQGAAYLTGTTVSNDFPTTPGAHDRTHNGNNTYDAFVTKLDPSGSRIEHSSLFGGADHDYASGIAIDGRGNAYVAGRTTSPDLPTSPGAFDGSYNGNPDGYVLALAAGDFSLLYATYLGGTGFDNFEVYGDIAVDRHGQAYVTGIEGSPDFPLTPDALPSPTTSGAFLTKLRADGTGLVFSTLLGSGAPTGVGVDDHGNAYVGGVAFDPRVPTTPGAYDTSFNGPGGLAGGDGFVMKVDTSRDSDGDGVADDDDNCPTTANADQHDADQDGIGDECDATTGNTPCAVAAKGRLATDKQARLDLDAVFRTGASSATGDLRYHDVDARLLLRATAITSLIAYSGHAVLRGAGTVDKSPVTYRVDLDAKPGAEPARVRLTLSSGYSASSAFDGDIAIRCPG